MQFSIFVSLVLMCFAGGLAAEPSPLGPENLVLLFNQNSKTSKQLADYYASKRGVPKDQILGLDLPVAETLPRARYEKEVIPALRHALNTNWKDKPICCLVTFYDVPIRIGPRQPSQQELAEENRLSQALNGQLTAFSRALDELDKVGRTTAPIPQTPKLGAARDPLKLLNDRYKRVIAGASNRLSNLKNEEDRKVSSQMMWTLIEKIEGGAGIVARLRPGNDAGEPALRRLKLARDRLNTLQKQLIALLRHDLLSPQRKQARQLTVTVYGLKGAVELIDLDIKSLKGKKSTAAFDSELSLAEWEGYTLFQWVTNPFYVEYSSQIQSNPGSRLGQKTYMVSRLDGPSPAIVRRMIDDALAVEKVGLRGKVYLDARGYRKKDGYLEYDSNLISLKRMLRVHTDLDVALDNKGSVFPPGSCPNAALYVGWYSLANYVPAFQFVRGAVGYHIASSEAVSLRDSKKKYWCKGLLRDGVVATLGPVNEPYLAAFPLPNDFVGLLLTGRYSLVECYYYTKRFNSWMMMLLGDPLYRPYGKTPQVKIKDVFLPKSLPLADLKQLILQPLEAEPTAGSTGGDS